MLPLKVYYAIIMLLLIFKVYYAAITLLLLEEITVKYVKVNYLPIPYNLHNKYLVYNIFD